MLHRSPAISLPQFESITRRELPADTCRKQKTNYLAINSLRMVEGRFFNDADNDNSAPVCVLGEAAKVNLLGFDPAVGKFVKINDTWLQVVGALASGRLIRAFGLAWLVQHGGATAVERWVKPPQT